MGAICVVTPEVAGVGFHGSCGSAQVALAELLARAGRRVTLLHTEPPNGGPGASTDWRKHFAGLGIDYVPVPKDPRMRLDASEGCARSYEVYLWLRGQSFQAVHFPETNGIGFYTLLAKRQGLAFAGTRFCLSVHGPSAWRRRCCFEPLVNAGELEAHFMERESVRLAEALAAPTRWMLGWLEQENWPMPTERRVLPTAISPKEASPSARIREFVYLGPLKCCPGLALFCGALDQLGPKALRAFSVTFADPENAPASKQSALYLYERSRRWTFNWQVAAKNTEFVFNYLQGPGRLAVMPARSENAPLALRRCLSLGAPFLAVDSGGVPELIDPASHATTLCPGTIKGLAEALRRAMNESLAPARPAPGLDAQISTWLAWHQNWLAETDAAAKSRGAVEAVPAPLVSVCLVHYNRPEYLAQCLASLRAQDYANYEIVLVDDGSTRPEAIQFLAALEPEFTKKGWQMVRQENRYLGAARNNAARHARGEYLMFMDDDNFAKPDEISTFVRVARQTGAEILTASMDLFEGAEAPDLAGKTRKRRIFLGAAAAMGAFRNCFGDANGFMRRESFWKVGGFTEDYGIGHEDWEFYARAVLKGCQMETIPEALFWYRISEDSMARKTSQLLNAERSFRPYLEAVPAPYYGLMQLLQGYISSPGEESEAATLNNHRLIKSLVSPKWRRSLRKRLAAVSRWFED